MPSLFRRSALPFLMVALATSPIAFAPRPVWADAPATPAPAPAPCPKASIKTLVGVKKVVAEFLDVEVGSIMPDSRFAEDLGIDAVNMPNLVDKLTDHFDIEIADEDIEKLTTVQEAANYIEQKLAEKKAS